MEISGKVVIVTGASSGIGLSTAKLLTEKGAKVALVARSKDKLQSLEKDLSESLAIVADMSKRENIIKMIKKVYDHYGRIDILINNAGRGYDSLIENIEQDKFRQLFDLNLLRPLFAMQEVIPIMRKQGGGMIINISSGTSLMYLENMGAYSSLKRALNGLTLTAREELSKDHIMCSVVYPYITATDFEKNMLTSGALEWGSENEDFSQLPKADRPEYVAEKILEAIETEKAEVYAHEWMDKRD